MGSIPVRVTKIVLQLRLEDYFCASVRGIEKGGAPQRAKNSPVDCFLARGRFPYGSRPGHGPYCRPWNISAASVRGSAAQATAASGGNREPEQGQRPQSASGESAPQNAGAAARDRAARGRFPYGSRPGPGPYCRPWNISAASVRGIAAQATAACGGHRKPEQGRWPQSAGGKPRRRMRVPRLVTGRRAGDSRTGHAQATGLIAGRGTDPQLPYEELLRRRPPPAAETGSRSRASGRRVQAGNRAAGCGSRGS